MIFSRSNKSCYRNIFSEDEGHADLKKLNAEFINEDLTKFARVTLISKMRQKGIVAQILFKSNFTEFGINRYRRGLETCPQGKRPKVDASIFFFFFRRVRATSMIQRRVENTRVHFWTL